MNKLYKNCCLLLLVINMMPVTAQIINPHQNKRDLLFGWKVQEGNNVYNNVSIPTTAMNVLINNGIYPKNILDGTNYKKVDDSHFNHPWIFRNYFRMEKLKNGQHALLKIDGINYSANILINGKRIAPRDMIKGPHHQYIFDITPWVEPTNELLIQVFPPKTDQSGISFDKSTPKAIDNNMGIVRYVSLKIVGDVLMNKNTISTTSLTEKGDEASLKLTCQLTNMSDREISGAIVGNLISKYIYYPVKLKGREKRTISLTPKETPALLIKQPHLWWCNNMGDASMNNISLEFDIKDQISDKDEISFGIREIKSYTTPNGQQGIMLNGKKVMLHGAVWTDNIFLNNTADACDNCIQYAKDMNLNVFRIDGLGDTSDLLYDKCDQNGILVLKNLPDKDLNKAEKSYLINHPCIIPQQLNIPIVDLGANLPVKESLAKIIPSDKLWPVNNEFYNYHGALTSGANNLDELTKNIDNSFGSADSLNDYLKKANLLNYNSTRNLFEANRLNEPNTSGLLYYKLNTAWPSLCQQLCDYYGQPTAAYFAVKKANAPLQIIYNNKDKTVYVVNAGTDSVKLSASMQLLDIKSKPLQQEEKTLTVQPGVTTKFLTIKPEEKSFLFLTLKDKNKKIIADNNYYITGNNDYKALSSLPASKLEITAKYISGVLHAKIKNSSNDVSFFNQLILKYTNGNMVLYPRWSDNYITLQPGETKDINCDFYSNSKEMNLTIRGWNTNEQTVKVQ